MKESHIKILTGLGVIAIIFVFLVQVFWIKEAFTISESQFEQTVTAALRQVAEKIAVKNKASFLHKNPVTKVNPRLYIVEVNTEIDATLLDHYLVNTFDYFNINQDVEYSIYSCEDNTMVYCNYIQKQKPQKKITLDQLPKFEGLNYYFSVSFPHYPIISLHNIPMWTITSAVLLLVVVFFLYALFVVFYQKSVTTVQKDFIRNMTHEFKTPLSTISVVQQVLSEADIHQNPVRIKKYAQIAGEEINRLNAMVEKVLHISSLEKKEFSLHKKEIEVHAIIDRILHALGHLPHEKEIQIKEHLGAENDVIEADEVHFTNVIFNIIENAIKYGHESVMLEVFSKNEKGKLILSIKDNGRGIPKKDIKRIFTKFYRVTEGDRHDVKGFGLGLFYVNQIIKAHKWTISVESDESTGSQFNIIIPQKH